MEEERIKAITVSADTGEWNVENSMSELRSLCDTAGADVVAEIVQSADKINPATYIGQGKAYEIREMIDRLDADMVIFDDSLSAVQTRNLEKIFEVPVIDRTVLILDIFARNAKTAEGNLQVELAQLEYRLPSLLGLGTGLSQQGGGIGTRGPGETKLETDRRHIRSRIQNLKSKLEELEKHRDLTRKARQKSGAITVALVGYTNVGKSTIFNRLTGSEVLAENKLFATLDPTARKLSVGNLQQVILVDTVGFVSRLPHNLVEAFKSTLDEVRLADLIVLVLDASDEKWEEQLKVTQQVIGELGCGNTPAVMVFNKCDAAGETESLPGLRISARTGEGMEKLLACISDKLSERVVRAKLLFPFDEAGKANALRERGNIIEEEWTEHGLAVDATVDRALWPRFEKYRTE